MSPFPAAPQQTPSSQDVASGLVGWPPRLQRGVGWAAGASTPVWLYSTLVRLGQRCESEAGERPGQREPSDPLERARWQSSRHTLS